MNQLLLVEDDELLGATIQLNLEAEGHQVDWVQSGLDVMVKARNDIYDLILLDISLPGIDGIKLLEQIRQEDITIPILILTVQSEVTTKVKAFELGADDYLTKPFDISELTARIKALLRRAQSKRQIPASRIIKIGKFSINLETREAQTREGLIILSEKETALLEFLVREGGKPLSRHDILDEVWGMDSTPTTRTVDNFLLRLRKLFEEDPRHPKYILTVRGIGYRLDLVSVQK